MKNQSIDQNIALKCNWNDAGYIDVCSNEAYHHNVKVRKASWCSHADCECRYWDYVDADNYPCWESKLFIDFSFHVAGSPWRITKSGPDKLALLTTRAPGDSEKDRFVFGYLFIEDIDEGDGFSRIQGSRKESLIIDEDIAPKLLFWDFYYNQKFNKPHWGSGIFRYVSDYQVYCFLQDLMAKYRLYNGNKEDMVLIEKHLKWYRPSAGKNDNDTIIYL